jgi:hypothetical protein
MSGVAFLREGEESVEITISVEEAGFTAFERRTGLDLRGVVNEGRSFDARAVSTGEEGKEIDIVYETNHSFKVFETPGLIRETTDAVMRAVKGGSK